MKIAYIILGLFGLGCCQGPAREPLRVPDRCHQEPDPGECGEYNVRWFYNPKVARCLRFLYRGCKGNGNNFPSEEACNGFCQPEPGAAATETDETPVDSDPLSDGLRETPSETNVRADVEDAQVVNLADDLVPEQNEPVENTNRGESALASEGEDNDEDEEDESDGTTEDQIIKKYLNTGDGLRPEDEEMLKEAMSQFEVSALETQEQETDEDTVEEDHPVETEGAPKESETQNVEDSVEPHVDEPAVGAAPIPDEDDEDAEEEDEIDDDEIIHKYMRHDIKIEPDDEEMLKEAMSQFEVSALQAQGGTEDDDEEIPEENDHEEMSAAMAAHPGEHKTNMESHADKPEMPEADHNINAPEEEEDDEEDDGTVDDALIKKYLNTGDNIEPEDSEMLREAMAQFEVSALDAHEEEVEEKDTDIHGEEQTHQIGSETIEDASSEKSIMENAENTERKDGEESDEDEEEFPENNGEKVDSFLDKLGEAIAVDDRETILEAISEFGAMSLEAVEDVNDEMREAMPHLDSPDESNMKSAETVNEGESEGVSPDDVSDKQEVENDSGFVDMKNIQEDDEDEGDAVKDVLRTEQDVVFNPDKMNAEDRATLSEMVSQYDVSVMEEKDTSSKDKEQPKPSENDIQVSTDKRLISPRCTLPAEIGPCRARKMKWYFDMETGDCRTFIYGGCQGNGNRFNSKRKCQRSCRDVIPFESGLEAFEDTFQSEEKKENKPFPTKRITVMMPFRSIFQTINDRINDKSFMPPRVAVPPENMDERREIPPPFPNMPRFPEPDMLPEKEMDFHRGGGPEDLPPPFSPLHFLLFRTLMKLPKRFPMNEKPLNPMVRPPPPPPMSLEGRRPKLHPKPRMPPMPNQAPMKPLPMPPVGRPMNLRPPPPLEPRERITSPTQERGPNIFAPSLTKNKKMKTSNYDNRHFSNISPKNKFTLLQVFVNKPHGAQSPAVTPVRGQLLPQDLDPSKLQNTPFITPRTAQKSNSPFYAPTAQTSYPNNRAMMPQNHRNQPMWNNHGYHHNLPPMHHHLPPMSHPHPMPEHHHHFNQPPMYNPFSQRSMYNPFHQQPLPYGLPSRPFPPQFQARRPPMMPERDEGPSGPLVVVTDGEDEEEDHSDNHYACLLPVAPGRCKAFQTRWYYNRDTEKCDIFYFTGCAGNANNFQTWEECASTCLDIKGPRTTMPAREPEEEHEEHEVDSDDDTEASPDTIYITSTVFPETEEEAKQAQQETDSGLGLAPDANVLRTTLDTPTEKSVEAHALEIGDNDEVLEERVSEASHIMSTEYITLMAVVAVIGLAVIVLVTVSIVHMNKKSDASKKEKVLEAVLNHHLYGDLPKMVHTSCKNPAAANNKVSSQAATN